jgi:hypothetical protein
VRERNELKTNRIREADVIKVSVLYPNTAGCKFDTTSQVRL